ncbi:MAG: hypothetical protein ACLRNW_11105 [Neglectibacter sp.]
MGGATPKTGAPGTKGRAAPLPGGKAPLGPKVREPRSLPGDLSKRSKSPPRPPGSPPSAAWPGRQPAPQREPPNWAGG